MNRIKGASFMINKCSLVFISVLLGGFGLSTNGQDATVEKSDETAEVQKAIQSYVSAFNSRDVEKLASHWSPEGVYTSRNSGEQVVGREAMVQGFTATFEGENLPTLAVATESIDFISPNVALERGTATVSRTDGDAVESTYSVVYVKRDGAWLIDRVTEEQVIVSKSNSDKLKGLGWLVGEWSKNKDGVQVEIACRWTRDQNYLSRTFKVITDGEVESSGLQLIGWDPGSQKIRSWLFDNNGGFVGGTWVKRDDHWVVQSVATLADGGVGSYTSVFRPRDDGTYSWEKINRVIDGKLLPNVDEEVVQRK